jgi:RNA polymerase sigma-70 factor (sigma-E family)
VGLAQFHFAAVTTSGLETDMGFGLVIDAAPRARRVAGSQPDLVDRPSVLARATRTGVARADVPRRPGQEGGPMTDGVAPAGSDPSRGPARGRSAEPVELVEPAAVAPISFEHFVRTETAGLLRSAYLLTGNAASAEDIVQETLTRLFPRWARVQDATYPQAYVRRSLVNTFLNSRRPRSATEIVVEDVGDRPSPVDLAQGVADSDLVWSLLGRIGERQRAVLVLRYFHDWTDADIAAAVGCRTGTVRSLLSRGLTALRTELSAGTRAEGGVGDA